MSAKRSFGMFLLVVLILTVFQLAAVAQVAEQKQPSAVPYVWKNVQIVGGGFVDGIIFHPTAKGVRYARTDMGGAYRYNDVTKRWEPMLDWVPYEDLNLMGMESIALDPANPNLVYLACGTYTNPGTPDGAILRSSDRGHTFQRTNVPIKFGGNENGRGNGERMAVDPNDGKILFLGTRRAGLWRSNDGAVTWTKVESFPDVTDVPVDPQRWWEGGSGIDLVVFDPSSGSKGKASSTIYVAASIMNRDNLFRSTDGGKTWKPVPGQPTKYRPGHAVLASDGTMYISYGTNPGPARMTDGAVWKFNTKTGEWTDITPVKPSETGRQFGYAAVSVDTHNPKVIIASTYNRWINPGIEDDIFRSTDGGGTWKPVFEGNDVGIFDYSLAPYVSATPLHWMFDIEIDPLNSNHAMFTTGYGGWETFNLTAMDKGKPTKWSIMSSGIEETVALELYSPAKGAHLISAVGDYNGFVHWDLDKPAPDGSIHPPYFDNNSGVTGAAMNPDVIVRVGNPSAHHHDGPIGYSLDGGKSWLEPKSLPKAGVKSGRIAVSADGTTWVWTPERSAVSVTSDRGTTWAAANGIPSDTRVIADQVNPKKFYGMVLFAGKFYVSSDGARTFTEQALELPGGLPQHGNRGDSRGDNRGGQDRIYATPERQGDIWLASFDGLYRSTDAGKSFSKLDGVQQLHGFGFGKAAPGSTYPTLYMIGTVNRLRGIFRSDGAARSWVRINDDQHQWGLVLQITGDPKRYGRVYVGTHGRGIFYGDPVGAKP